MGVLYGFRSSTGNLLSFTLQMARPTATLATFPVIGKTSTVSDGVILSAGLRKNEAWVIILLRGGITASSASEK